MTCSRPSPICNCRVRGEPLRDAILLRLIAIERGIHSVVFGLLAIVLVVLDAHLGALHISALRWRDQLDAIAAQSGRHGSRTFLDGAVRRVLGLHGTTVTVLAVTATVYALVEGVEAVGLWQERRWAEYLTVVATAGFLPFEVRELVKHFTVLRVGAIVVNLAVLAWLVWAKRLFGVRGGPQSIADRLDWEHIVAHPDRHRLDARNLATKPANGDAQSR